MRHRMGITRKPEGDNNNKKEPHRPMSKRLMLLLGKANKPQDHNNKKN